MNEILGFVNEKTKVLIILRDNILEGETDPNVVYDLKNKLDEYHIYQPNEVERFAEAYYAKRDSELQAVLVSCIKPARDRFEALMEVQKNYG